jgi:hypothetical protein
MKKIQYMTKSSLMRFGIEGMLISIIRHYLSLEKWFKEYHNSNPHMKEFSKDVPLGKISRNHSQVATTDPRKS